MKLVSQKNGRRLLESTHPSITFVILVNSCLPHGCRVEGETCLFQKIEYFLTNPVADDTGVDKDDRVTLD